MRELIYDHFYVFIGAYMFPALALVLFTGMPVAYALGGVALIFGFVGIWLEVLDFAVFFQIVQRIWGGDGSSGAIQNPILVAIPCFVFMGTMLEKSRVAADLLHILQIMLKRIPGGLALSVTVMGTIMAATTGIIGASVVLLALLGLPPMLEARYAPTFAAGTVCAVGTLGILIPPSIMLVLMADRLAISVGDLFLGAVIPGLLLAGLYIAFLVLYPAFRPEVAPAPEHADKVDARLLWSVFRDIVPAAALILTVLGSIFFGIATPTEAASIGVVFALIIAAMNRALNVEMLKAAFEGTMRSTAMIMLIILAAVFLNFVLGFMGITQAILETIKNLGWTPMETMLVIICFYLLLGMFMETLSMMLTTIPVVFPIVVHMGFDPIWFGIMITVLMEAALITPPIGINLYVVHGIRARGGKFSDVSIGAVPFLFAMFFLIGFLLIVPGIATWLPDQFYR